MVIHVDLNSNLEIDKHSTIFDHHSTHDEVRDASYTSPIEQDTIVTHMCDEVRDSSYTRAIELDTIVSDVGSNASHFRAIDVGTTVSHICDDDSNAIEQGSIVNHITDEASNSSHIPSIEDGIIVGHICDEASNAKYIRGIEQGTFSTHICDEGSNDKYIRAIGEDEIVTHHYGESSNASHIRAIEEGTYIACGELSHHDTHKSLEPQGALGDDQRGTSLLVQNDTTNDEDITSSSEKASDLKAGVEPNCMVNWLGRPITKDHPLGGPQTSFIILGVVVCGYFAFGGVFFNLVIYLRRVWGQGSANASNNSTNLVGTVYCTCILGAFLGDTYLGRMLTVTIFLVVYTMGGALSAVAVTMKEKEGAAPEGLLMMGLYVMAVGCGSYQPVIVSLGGDQFINAASSSQKARFFSWVFVASNIGVMLALTLLTYLENTGRWALGFWISAASVGVSIPMFLIGVPYMQQSKHGGNPLLDILQVLVSAARKCYIKTDDNMHLLSMSKEAGVVLGPTNCLRWIEKAAIVTKKDMDNNAVPNPWRLCTKTQVEEAKCVMRIIPLIFIGIMYNVANAQLVSLFVVQADTMDNSIMGFRIPPGSMRLFTNLAGIIFPIFYEYVIVPRIRTMNGHAKGLTSLQRMGWGLVSGAFAMVTAALLERQRLKSTFKLPILWLIPQFTIMGVSNSLFIVSQMDFFYSEIPQRMQSLGSSLFLLCMGLGNYGSSLIVTLVTIFSSLHHDNWIPHQINEGHLNYFYWLLVGILFLTLIVFLIYASFYENIQIHNHNIPSMRDSLSSKVLVVETNSSKHENPQS